MSINKVATIVERIIPLTEKGEIEWEQTEKDEVFQASFPDFSIRLFQQPSSIRDPSVQGTDYVINIYNSSGISIESASDVDLHAVLDDPYRKMEALFNSARGYALGTEQTLDNILSVLEDKDEIPF